MHLRPFDIETGPQSLEIIKSIVGEFDEANVSLGNLVDPVKIAAKIQGARENYDADLVDMGALSPLTANVVSITYQVPDGVLVDIDTSDEFGLLSRFWEKYSNRDHSAPMSGWNITDFDMPMIRNRSLLLDVPTPRDAWSFSPTTGYTNWLGVFDMLPYLRGTRANVARSGASAGWSLGEVARAFGLPGKNGDGARFATLVRSGDPTDLENAISYAHNDVALCSSLAAKLGFKVSLEAGMLFEPRSASHPFLATRNPPDFRTDTRKDISLATAPTEQGSERLPTGVTPEDDIPFH
jgi:hypothetical protein